MTFNTHIMSMVIALAFCIDSIRLFDTFKPITVERLIVHTRGLCA